MLTFKNITQKDASTLRKYYQNCQFDLCEYSVGVKLMWHGPLHPAFAEVAGCLIVRLVIDGQYVFDYPVALPDGDEDAALTAIDSYCTDTGIFPSFAVVPEERAGLLALRYPRCHITSLPVWKDYIYNASDLAHFTGRRYSGQRNHINKFRAAYPTAAFRVLTGADKALIEAFWTEYERVFPKADDRNAAQELKLARKMLRMAGKPWFCVGGMEYEGKLLSLCLAERCGNSLIIHIEKALYNYEGVYPATVSAFAQQFAGCLPFINREDDGGDRGLRTSKQQYLPVRMGGKLSFSIRNELQPLAEVPTLKTERLVLGALHDGDSAAYNALCLDDERNRYWGYDYRKDLNGALTEDYFLSVARTDFANKQAVNFAVRREGVLIGEVVLYRFDYRGGAELGCRIAPAYAHCGYGTEAFAAAAEWALYRLNLARVKAKCFKENESSRRMLASCMRPDGEDETFFYFEKRV